MTVNEMVKNYLKGNNIKQQEIANVLGVGQSYVSQMLNGEKPIGRNAADTLSREYGFSKMWLLTGEGEMLRKPEEITIGDNSNNTILGDNNNVGNNITVSHARPAPHSPTEKGNPPLHPIIPKALASKPNTDVYAVVKNDHSLELNYMVAIPPYTDFDFFYQVRQDAMQPTYMEGDVLALVHLEPGTAIIQGAAMVIDTNDFGFLLRRIYDRGDSYECRCINKESAFEDQTIPKSNTIRLYRIVYSVRLGD